MPLPAIKVALDDGTGTYPYDISAFVRLVDGLTFTRGRQDEFATVDPGRFSCTLDNKDGRFTLGHPIAASTYGLRVDQGIRVTERVNGVDYIRFTGYVDSWPTEWNGNKTGSKARCSLVAVDGLARLQRRRLESMALEEVRALNPQLSFPLSSATAYRVADGWGGSATSPLTTVAGTPSYGSFDFAQAAGLEGAKGATFGGTTLLRSSAPMPAGSDTGGALMVLFQTATPPPTGQTYALASLMPDQSALIGGAVRRGFVIGMNSSGRIVVRFVGGGSTEQVQTGGVNYADGQTHLVVVSVTSLGAVTVTVNSIQQATGTLGGLFSSTGAGVTIGGTQFGQIDGATPLRFTGGLALVSAFNRTVLDLGATLGIKFGGASETAGQRFYRLMSYAGFTGSSVFAQGTAEQLTAQATSGTSLADAVNAVAATEGGLVAVDPSGVFTLYSRRFRPGQSIRLAIDAAAGQMPESVTFPGDKQYLANEVTATGASGNQVVASNQESIDLYGTYTADAGTVMGSDDFALDTASWRLGQYADPSQPRATGIGIDLIGNLDAGTVAAALGVDIGRRVQVQGLPAQAPSSTVDLIVEGYTESVSTSGWTLDFNTTPYSLWRTYVLDESVLDGPDRIFY